MRFFQPRQCINVGQRPIVLADCLAFWLRNPPTWRWSSSAGKLGRRPSGKRSRTLANGPTNDSARRLLKRIAGGFCIGRSIELRRYALHNALVQSNATRRLSLRARSPL